jgi:hypothetical protein
MRKLIVRAFNLSLDGVSANYGTQYFDWCMSGIDPRVTADASRPHLPADESQLDPTGELYRRADALIMGRVSYERMAGISPRAAPRPAIRGPASSTRRARSCSPAR